MGEQTKHYPTRPVDLAIAVGEASGDWIGALAIEHLIQGQSLHMEGIAGPKLRDLGVKALHGSEELSVRGYVEVLAHWGLVRDGLNPVARSNVCPAFDAPAEPSFHAFSFTVPDAQGDTGRDFVVAGSGGDVGHPISGRARSGPPG